MAFINYFVDERNDLLKSFENLNEIELKWQIETYKSFDTDHPLWWILFFNTRNSLLCSWGPATFSFFFSEPLGRLISQKQT